jgi:hypothetical protein
MRFDAMQGSTFPRDLGKFFMEFVWAFCVWLYQVLRKMGWLLGLLPLLVDYISVYVRTGYRPFPITSLIEEGLSTYWALGLAVCGIVLSSFLTHREMQKQFENSTTVLRSEIKSLRDQLVKEERVAKAELLVAFRHWWWSIHDYETSLSEQGSASLAGVIPSTPDIGIQLENFEDVKTTVWVSLTEETRQAVTAVEDIFLRFVTRLYASAYNHEIYGDKVPKQIMRNDKIAMFIGTLVSAK